ncbi:MAG: CRISPR-associated endoribonuclease Cas6 [Selenomonadaceae bacterium]|nr:CRISPR-associated endoribonuclease Cas6 [Selenomonadaceae bacterium]
MLAKLTLLLDTKELDYRAASTLQGLLMERINPDYAAYLHAAQFHPYSQQLIKSPEGMVWQINTLNEEAYHEIIEPLAQGSPEFYLRHQQVKLTVLERKTEILPKRKLVEDFYGKGAHKNLTVIFQTPTAFRQNKRYIILPEVRLLVQNLMMKYAAADGDTAPPDADALTQIIQDTFITRHKLSSRLFPLESTVIPGFVGQATFQVRGTETMARYLRLLLTFGEFSGVGVRTAMGMGAMRLRDE